MFPLVYACIAVLVLVSYRFLQVTLFFFRQKRLSVPTAYIYLYNTWIYAAIIGVTVLVGMDT